MNYITQIVQTVRVPNVNAVEALHTELRNDKKFELTKFEYSHKEIKEKGEVVDEYELVKATMAFNDEKIPDSEVKISFDINNLNSAF